MTDAKMHNLGSMTLWVIAAWIALLFGGFATLFAQSPRGPSVEVDKDQAGQPTASNGIKVSGPYQHNNLAVYLLHSDNRDDRQFITLNEGLKSGKIKVTELSSERVNRLMIENTSDKPLFLQEGDRVTGGKQDRTVYSSLVIAAKSGLKEIPTFCIESSRWSTGVNGRKFVANGNTGYASNAVRQAAKLSVNQGRVWKKVAEQKKALQNKIGTDNKTSSLNEAIDSKKIINSTKAYKDELGGLISKHKDAVGIAFALDGELAEINVFPGHPLVSKVYPRLLETYAVDAAISDKTGKKTEAPTTAVVEAMMKSNLNDKAERDENIDGHNRLRIFVSSEADASKKHTYRCETICDNDVIHRQWLRAEKPVAAKKNGLPVNQNNLFDSRTPNAPQQRKVAPPQTGNGTNSD